MNIKTRAHRIQRMTGWSYQKSLEAIRTNGLLISEVARSLNCSIREADEKVLVSRFAGVSISGKTVKS